MTEASGVDGISPTVEELSHFVLIIRESPGGGVTHQWQRVETFSGLKPSAHAPMNDMDGTTMFAVAHPRDCHEEYLECFRKCMSRPLARGYGHMTEGRRGNGAKEEYCYGECRQPYMDCEELQGVKPQKFSAVDEAVDWLSLHQRTLVTGGLVFIAGVAFFAVSGGVGLIVLAPVLLLNSADAAIKPYLFAKIP